MAWDDPIVWILLVGAIILLFGSNKIPELARSLGKAKKEFDLAKSGLVGAINSEINNVSPQSNNSPQLKQPTMNTTTAVSEPLPEDDPLLVAARNEGIDTRGKSRSEIASELASKIKD